MIVRAFSQFLYESMVFHLSKSRRGLRDNICIQLDMILRNAILKIQDPVIRMKIGNEQLNMHLSHSLPLILVSHPFYNKALCRISTFLKEEFGYLSMIDIGANIGDTVTLVRENVNDGTFICIEGDEKYYSLLLENLQAIDNVVCEQVFCGESNKNGSLLLLRKGGTSVIGDESALSSSRGNNMSTIVTLDSLINKHQAFSNANLLKIDTDGYDYKVIRGGKKFLSDSKPVILFELSPCHLIATGENPMTIFPLFQEIGYHDIIFYDNTGLLITKLTTDDIEQISALIRYASTKKDFYYDVILFHRRNHDILEKFYTLEQDFFKERIPDVLSSWNLIVPQSGSGKKEEI